MDDTATDEEDEDETTERWCSNIKIVFIQIIVKLGVQTMSRSIPEDYKV